LILWKKYAIIFLNLTLFVQGKLIMQNRIKSIYKELYNGVKSKKYFANLYGVTTKTIENTVAKMDDVVYDKKLSAYRFVSLLPKYIPHNLLIEFLQKSISNESAKEDFLTLSEMLKKQDINLSMVSTSLVSPLTQKIIMLEVAIRSNCIIKMNYIGNTKPMEEKYIKPHKINTSDNSYYLYASYDNKNKKDVGEYRSFAINSIQDITPIEWVKDEQFLISGEGNAYGMIKKDKWVILHLTKSSANYFKRERQFSKEQFDFISEESDGRVVMKMYYNNIKEVIQLVQKWAPFIKVDDNVSEKEYIYKAIVDNIEQLTKV